MPLKQQQPEPDKRKSRTRNVLVYTGLGFQILASIALFTFIGSRIDRGAERTDNLFTAIFALLGVIIGIFLAIKDFILPKKKDPKA